MILRILFEYKMDPDNYDQAVVVLIDEANLVFSHVDWKNFPPEMRLFLGQLRHVNVKCAAIAQKLYQIDKTFRGQCTGVKEFTKHFMYVQSIEYELMTDDGTNIHDPMVAEEVNKSHYATPGMLSRFFGSWVSWWYGYPAFGSMYYDTNELLNPAFNLIAPRRKKLETEEQYFKRLWENPNYQKLEGLFPRKIRIRNDFDYASFIQERNKDFLEHILTIGWPRVKKYYAQIANRWQSGDPNREYIEYERDEIEEVEEKEEIEEGMKELR